MPKHQLWRYFHNGYPDCQQTIDPTSQSCQHRSNDAAWEATVMWLTGDSTFLRKMEWLLLHNAFQCSQHPTTTLEAMVLGVYCSCPSGAR